MSENALVVQHWQFSAQPMQGVRFVRLPTRASAERTLRYSAAYRRHLAPCPRWERRYRVAGGRSPSAGVTPARRSYGEVRDATTTSTTTTRMTDRSLQLSTVAAVMLPVNGSSAGAVVVVVVAVAAEAGDDMEIDYSDWLLTDERIPNRAATGTTSHFVRCNVITHVRDFLVS